MKFWKRNLLIFCLVFGLLMAKEDDDDDFDIDNIDIDNDDDMFLDVDEWTGEPVEKKVKTPNI